MIRVSVGLEDADDLSVGRGASREEVEAAALGDDNVRRHLEGAEVRKVIHVPDRLINLVAG